MTPAEQLKLDIRRQKSMAMRFKKPALADMGYENLVEGLRTIIDDCDEIRYFVDNDDGSDGGLMASTDGDEDLAEEFKMAFVGISDDADTLWELLERADTDLDEQTYNDCTCALIGNRYNMVGYDDFEVDYYALVGYESELAQSEAGERLMRKAKKEMISTIGQCMGVAMAFQDLRLRFDYLKAAMDVQMGINLELLKVSREIDEAYEKEDWRTLERMVGKLPERAWVE